MFLQPPVNALPLVSTKTHIVSSRPTFRTHTVSSTPTFRTHIVSSTSGTQLVTAKMGDQLTERRTANYKPNSWKHDVLQFLPDEYSDKKYKLRALKLREEVTCMFVEANYPLAKLELVDSITKLGLSKHFGKEIKEALDFIASNQNYFSSINKENLYFAALCFRVLRQHGYGVSQDMILCFMNNKRGGKFMPIIEANAGALLELFEASHLASDTENILAEARLFSMDYLKCFGANSDAELARRVAQVLNLPLHWRVGWYNVKKQIQEHEKENKLKNQKLVELAKVNFNIIHAVQLEDLKEIVRWWLNLGTAEKLSFSRDRIVESFMYAGGVASEPQDRSLRRWLTKVIQLILIIDDFYDIYGSIDELKCFTNAVARWNSEDIKDLPESMKFWFWVLWNTTNEMAVEIQQEKCWTSISPYLQKAWADFCKSLLLEAEWYYNGNTPSLQEYLSNGWISSSGPLLSLLVIFGKANPTTKTIPEVLEESRHIIYHSSLIIRLCNDQGTSTAELERGDVASSILCYKREANVTEEAAREHIRSIILGSWRKINTAIATSASDSFLNYVINTARMAHFIYQHGDGIGNPEKETRKEIMSNLIESFPLN